MWFAATTAPDGWKQTAPSYEVSLLSCSLAATSRNAMATVAPQHICYLCTRKFTDAVALKTHVTQLENIGFEYQK